MCSVFLQPIRLPIPTSHQPAAAFKSIGPFAYVQLELEWDRSPSHWNPVVLQTQFLLFQSPTGTRMLPAARTRFHPDGCLSKIMALVTHPGRVQEFSFVSVPIGKQKKNALV